MSAARHICIKIQPSMLNACDSHPCLCDGPGTTPAEHCGGAAMQGAATTVYAAVAEGLEEHSGAYLQNCQISRPAKAVEDEQLAAELWRVTEQQIQEAMPGHVPA